MILEKVSFVFALQAKNSCPRRVLASRSVGAATGSRSTPRIRCEGTFIRDSALRNAPPPTHGSNQISPGPSPRAATIA